MHCWIEGGQRLCLSVGKTKDNVAMKYDANPNKFTSNYYYYYPVELV